MNSSVEKIAVRVAATERLTRYNNGCIKEAQKKLNNLSKKEETIFVTAKKILGYHQLNTDKTGERNVSTADLLRTKKVELKEMASQLSNNLEEIDNELKIHLKEKEDLIRKAEEETDIRDKISSEIQGKVMLLDNVKEKMKMVEEYRAKMFELRNQCQCNQTEVVLVRQNMNALF
uniref:Myosin_tail_1 domain-containing protein n=1 Tax=Parastrongyloides trichosuri TaxID=131310 RepID=A0A0N4Z6X8_PARTI